MLPIKAGIPVARGRRDVKYNEGAQLDPSQMGGGRGSGGKIAIGGGAGLIVLLLALLFGINPGDILGGAPQAGPEQSEKPSQFAQCTRGSISIPTATAGLSRTRTRSRTTGKTISRATRRSRCRPSPAASTQPAATRPQRLDPSTVRPTRRCTSILGFDQLTGQLGAEGGDAAEAYVLAHEFGHPSRTWSAPCGEVQSSGQGTGPTSPAVRLELQADCYAGVWFRHATEDPESPITEVTQEDLGRAVDAAQAVGDDRIQEKMQGQVPRKAGPMVHPQCDVNGLPRASTPAIRTSATRLPGTPSTESESLTSALSCR